MRRLWLHNTQAKGLKIRSPFIDNIIPPVVLPDGNVGLKSGEGGSRVLRPSARLPLFLKYLSFDKQPEQPMSGALAVILEIEPLIESLK